MNFSDVVRLGQEALTMVLMIGAPALGAAVVVGTGVSLVQAVTQVHEQTLSFLPKLLVVGGVLVASSGWMLDQIVGYTHNSFDQIRTINHE